MNDMLFVGVYLRPSLMSGVHWIRVLGRLKLEQLVLINLAFHLCALLSFFHDFYAVLALDLEAFDLTIRPIATGV